MEFKEKSEAISVSHTARHLLPENLAAQRAGFDQQLQALKDSTSAGTARSVSRPLKPYLVKKG